MADYSGVDGGKASLEKQRWRVPSRGAIPGAARRGRFGSGNDGMKLARSFMSDTCLQTRQVTDWWARFMVAPLLASSVLDTNALISLWLHSWLNDTLGQTRVLVRWIIDTTRTRLGGTGEKKKKRVLYGSWNGNFFQRQRSNNNNKKKKPDPCMTFWSSLSFLEFNSAVSRDQARCSLWWGRWVDAQNHYHKWSSLVLHSNPEINKHTLL